MNAPAAATGRSSTLLMAAMPQCVKPRHSSLKKLAESHVTPYQLSNERRNSAFKNVVLLRLLILVLVLALVLMLWLPPPPSLPAAAAAAAAFGRPSNVTVSKSKICSRCEKCRCGHTKSHCLSSLKPLASSYGYQASSPVAGAAAPAASAAPAAAAGVAVVVERCAAPTPSSACHHVSSMPSTERLAWRSNSAVSANACASPHRSCDSS